jgi:hypothetical protein
MSTLRMSRLLCTSAAASTQPEVGSAETVYRELALGASVALSIHATAIVAFLDCTVTITRRFALLSHFFLRSLFHPLVRSRLSQILLLWVSIFKRNVYQNLPTVLLIVERDVFQCSA